jgi:multidrug efflux pump subunit AcrA (membrane-fusion protein)
MTNKSAASRCPLRAGAIAGAMMLLAAALPSLRAEPVASAVPSGMTATVTKAKKGCFLDTLLVMGALVAENEVLVRPEREGLQLAQILVEPGDAVSSGQVLARLVPPEGQQGSSVVVRAPVAGVVSAAPVVVGARTSARGEPLFRILAEGEVELVADISPQQLTKLAAGQPAKVKVAGMDEAPGRVRTVSATVDTTSQLGQVGISLDRDARLRPGAFGKAVVGVGERCDGIAVPLSALLHGADGAVVQVIRNNRIETRRVTVGLLDESNAEIREGLSEGDMVVVRPGAFLREGDRVRPVVTGGTGGPKME